VLRIGGNRIKNPVRLLSLVCEKGGRERVRLRPGPDVYHPCCEEFLSLCLPDFSRQQGSSSTSGKTEEWIPSERPHWSPPDLDDLEERLVQQALAEKLAAPGGDPSFAGEASDAARWAVAGLAIALLSSGKTPGKMVAELEALMGSEYARPLLEWLVSHLRTLRH